MSHFVFILLVEALLVLLISFIVLSVFNWKKKKQNAAEIERLLAQIEENDTKRRKHLVSYLTSELSLEEQSAMEQVEDFIVAEKRFTQQFLEIQLNQQPVSGFYQNSCEFADKYLQLIAENIPKPIDKNLDITSEASLEDKKEVSNSQEIEVENKESIVKGGEDKDIEPEILESKSEEIDSSETSQTPSSEAESTEETNNSEGEKNDSEEKPDWGDAFAEAGVEMKESISEKNIEN